MQALGVDFDETSSHDPGGSLFREYAPFAEALPIKSLKLAGNGLADADGIALLHLVAMQPQIQYLDLSRNLDLPCECVVPLFQHLTQLTFLKLSTDFVDSSSLKLPAALLQLTTLRHLDLSHADISCEELTASTPAFAHLSSLSHLVLLGIDALRLHHGAAMLLILPPSMRHLQLVWHACSHSDPPPPPLLHPGGPSHAATFASTLTRLAELTAIEFGSWPHAEHAALATLFKSLCALPALAALEARAVTPSSDACRDLEAVSSLTHVSLALNRCRPLAAITSLTQLQSLDLDSSDALGGEGSLWCHLKPLTSLRQLVIAGFTPSVPAAQALAAAVPALSCLTKLQLGLCTNSRNRDAALRPVLPPLLTRLTHLRHLHVGEWSTSGLGAPDLAYGLSSLARLQHLHVNGITRESALRESGYERAAAAGGTHDESAGAALGAAVAAMAALTHLHLADFHLPDSGAFVAALRGMTALEVFALPWGGIGDSDSEALAEVLGGLTRVTEVRVCVCERGLGPGLVRACLRLPCFESARVRRWTCGGTRSALVA